MRGFIKGMGEKVVWAEKEIDSRRVRGLGRISVVREKGSIFEECGGV